jgi:hypothetical protein
MKKRKSLPRLKAELQIIFNSYIRERDKNQPCISCGQFKTLQAGHFFPVQGYDALRFDQDNVHGECAGCNCFDEGHLIGYQDNLRARIGNDRLEKLKERARAYKKNGYKWTRSELEEMIITYKNKLKNERD